MRSIFLIFTLLLLCSCGASKSTIGSPSSFSATGDGLNLRSALRVTGETALQMMSVSPARGKMSVVRGQLVDRIQKLLAGLDLELGQSAQLPTTEGWYSVRDTQLTDDFILAGDGQRTFFQFQTLIPGEFLFVRVFRESDQIHGIISYDDEWGVSVSVVVQYSMTCADSYLWDEVSDMRRNGNVTVRPGRECLGLTRYRPESIPAVVNEVSRRAPADLSRVVQIRNLEEFYETY